MCDSPWIVLCPPTQCLLKSKRGSVKDETYQKKGDRKYPFIINTPLKNAPLMMCQSRSKKTKKSTEKLLLLLLVWI